MYQDVKNAYLGDKRTLVPEKYHSSFINLKGAFDAHYLIWKLLCRGGVDKGKVLIIGVHGGRDYFGLKLKGYDVHGFDLCPDPDFNQLKIGNVEEELPYADGEFDAVIMSNIIEHLKFDATALTNVRRIIRDKGLLIVAVPFLNDIPEHHIRVHTRKSCQRLLTNCGYEILETVERPGILRLPNWSNQALHLMGWITLKLFGFLPHTKILPLYAEFEYRIGHIYHPIRRLSRGYCGCFLCRKSDEKSKSYLEHNVDSFSARHTDKS